MGNISKLNRYLKRNGIANTYYAVKERLLETKGVPYNYVKIPEGKLIQQAMAAKNSPVSISIVVPVYETPEKYLRELLNSILHQSYPGWELILADASKTDKPGAIISEYSDERIKYFKLEENKGISENTNAAVRFANGDYLALLDHDDLLTEDAIFEMATAIIRAKANGIDPAFVYSDEDKCDGEAKIFSEPNIKPEFNFDYLLSNNYICHFTLIKRELFETYKFRKEYDGAQDHDLFVRITGDLTMKGEEERIIHIPKVLYHWRCHSGSTSANTDSKLYAYEAGKRCVSDYTGVEVSHTAHLGFYYPEYGSELFAKRADLGAVGGLISYRNKITGGIYNNEGVCPYIGMDKHFSGSMHRLHCTHTVDALDIRKLTPRRDLVSLHSEAMYRMQQDIMSSESDNNKNEIAIKWSLWFAERVHEKGYKLLYDPKYSSSTEYFEKIEEEILPISVVIPNYNGLDYLIPCLDSVRKSSVLPYEIIVVDNGSKDGSVSYIKENYPEVIILEHSDNYGFTGAANHGFIEAKMPFVFLLNNDTIIERDCIKNLFDVIWDDESIFSAGALMLSMDSPDIVDNAGDSFNLLGYARSFALGKNKGEFEGKGVKSVFTACAGAAVYRKRILGEIGLLDDRHFAYLEDVDLGYRARIYGYRNVNVSTAIVYHKGSAVSGSRHNEFKVMLSSRNAVYLAMKNMPLLQYILNWPFLLIGRCIKFFFFSLKGLGKAYLKGTTEGIFKSFSREGRLHHICFKLKYLKNYLYIQLWMIKTTIFGH